VRLSSSSIVVGLNASNIQQALDTQSKLINIAKLHNAPNEKQSELINIHNMMVCVAPELDPGRYRNMGIISCADQVTDLVANHQLGNNQTMIHLAKEYLKTQGIQ
jgi:hypothetical protein